VDKQMLTQSWDQTRQKYGIYLRLLQAIPADKLHTNPAPGMRTPAQLVAHVSGTVIRDIAEGVAKGEITADEDAEAGVAGGLKTHADILAFARTCWARADAAVGRTGDPQLQAVVGTPWGMSFPGAVGFHLQNEEFLHHRGQLYVFARLCGATNPPFIYSYGDNAPEFRPAG
jgi:uncharacterized damage-inducible protein DinB